MKVLWYELVSLSNILLYIKLLKEKKFAFKALNKNYKKKKLNVDV